MSKNQSPLLEEQIKFYKALTEGDVTEVQKIIERGVDLEQAVAYSDSTPLEIAVAYGRSEIVKILLKSGVTTDYGNKCSLLESATTGNDINAFDLDGDSALHLASNHANVPIIEALLEAGADVNIGQEFNGWTALMEAVVRDNLQIAETLIKAGADVNARDQTGNTALSLARKNGNNEMIQLLLYTGAKED